MNIEYGKMRITEVPNVIYIDVSKINCEIKFTGLTPLTFIGEELQEVYAAIGEALKYMEAPIAEKSDEPRVWKAGDPEPDNVTAVIDCDDDMWVKNGKYWEHSGQFILWDELTVAWSPLAEAK